MLVLLRQSLSLPDHSTAAWIVIIESHFCYWLSFHFPKMDFTKNHCFLLWLVFYFSSLEEKQGLYLFFFSFWSPWKHQKTKSFLIFSGGIERKYWEEMGLKNSDSSKILSKKCHRKFTGNYIAGIYLFKVNNANTKAMCEICSTSKNEDTRATSMTLFWYIY